MSRSRHPGSVWLSGNGNYDTLPKKEWVAVDQNGMVAHALSYDILLNEIKEKCINRKDVVVIFVDR